MVMFINSLINPEYLDETASLLISGRAQLDSAGSLLMGTEWTWDDLGRKEIYLEDCGQLTSLGRLEDQD